MEENVVDFLGETLLFSGLKHEILNSFASLSALRKFKKGETIFAEGDEAEGFYVIRKGLVRIFKISAAGREQTLHILGPGEPFGEVAVFFGMDYPAYAMALDHCMALFFPKDRFVNAIKVHPELALAMLGVLAMRLRAFSRLIEDLSLKEVPQRLAAYILSIAEVENRTSSGCEIKLQISKNLLATILGTSPETLSRVFRKLEDQEVIERKNSRLYLKDLEKLKDLADGIIRLT